MLYGTFAATQVLARSTISVRVMPASSAPAGGAAGRPVAPCSGARGPWGVPGSSPAGAPARWGAWAAAGSAAAGPAPRADTAVAEAAAVAVATTRVRYAAGWAGARPAGACGRTRRQ